MIDYLQKCDTETKQEKAQGSKVPFMKLLRTKFARKFTLVVSDSVFYNKLAHLARQQPGKKNDFSAANDTGDIFFLCPS